MYYEDQAVLPGGSIGPPKDGPEGTTVWTRARAREGPDPELERTTLRWHPESDGWYIVRHDKRTRAEHRRGPFPTMQKACTALEADASAAAADESFCERSERVMREGIAERIRRAALRWTSAVDAALVADAGAGNRAPTMSSFHEVADPESRVGGERAEEARRRFQELLQATERWRAWHEN